MEQLIGNGIRSFSSYLEGHLWKEAFLFPPISPLSLSVREDWAKNTSFFSQKAEIKVVTLREKYGFIY